MSPTKAAFILCDVNLDHENEVLSKKNMLLVLYQNIYLVKKKKDYRGKVFIYPIMKPYHF